MSAEVQGPAPPPGLTPYSMYFAPRVEETRADASMEAWLHVSEALVADDSLYAVALFRYAVDEGWTVLANQTLEEETRTLHAIDARLADRYVILGPEDMLLERVAAVTAQDSPDIFSNTSTMSVSDLGQYAPLTPLTQDSADAQADTAPWDDPTKQRMIGAKPQPKAEDAEADLDSFALEDGEPVGTMIGPGLRRPPPKKKVRPLQYDVRAASEWSSGHEIQMTVPGTENRLTIAANTLIRARCAVLNHPPLALPAGLEAYSDYIVGEHDPKPAKTETFITLHTKITDEARREGLKIYACTAARGWYPLPRQRIDDSEGDIVYTALDRLPKTYAILGPAR